MASGEGKWIHFFYLTLLILSSNNFSEKVFTSCIHKCWYPFTLW